MKKLLVAGIAAFAFFSVPAVAGEPIFNWTGVYVGAQGGYGFATNDWANLQDPLFPIVNGRSAGGGHSNGGVGGFQAGYNYQVGRVVYGVEGAGSWASLMDTFVCAGFNTTAACTNNANWMASLTGRVGWTTGAALLYAKGGVAWVGDTYNANSTSFGAVWNTSTTRTGWTLGAGVEYAIDAHWSARFEYDYFDFGTTTVNFPPGVGGLTDPFSADINQKIQIIQVGANYRFSVR